MDKSKLPPLGNPIKDKVTPPSKDESLTSKPVPHMPAISKSTTSVDHPHPQVIEKPHFTHPSQVKSDSKPSGPSVANKPHVPAATSHKTSDLAKSSTSVSPPKKPPLANEYPKMMYAASGERTSNISEGSPQFVNKIVNTREEEEVLVKSGWLFKPAGGV